MPAWFSCNGLYVQQEGKRVATETITTTQTEFSEFLVRHGCCGRVRPIAADRWSTPAEAWEDCQVPDWLIWYRKKCGFEDEDVQALRIWACWCVRQAVHLMSAPESRQALEVAERFVEGEATAEQLTEVAGPAAQLADGCWPSAAEAWAARAAAELAAFRPVRAARAAAEALAWNSEGRSAWHAARHAQCDKLRELIIPQCKGGPEPEGEGPGVGDQGSAEESPL
jgi:hypothetical protein